jgi:hypothetical protein
MPRDLDQDEASQLLDLIEVCGLDSVLMAMSEICGKKGELIAPNHATKAKQWFRMEGAIGVLVTQARGLD